jgi:chemotaxis protein CheC
MHRVLIIDDSIYIRQTTRRILEEAGYEVFEAENGAGGLLTADQCQPDCVMLDLLMPDMDGFDVLRKLRELRNTIPVIIFSSDIQDSARKRCFDLGAFDFFGKPPQADVLLSKLKIAIALNQRGQTLLLSDKQNDVLKEMINIGVGRGAEMLNAILDTHISLEVPFVRVLSQTEFENDIRVNKVESLAAVNLSFQGDISGSVELIFPKESAANLVAAIVDEDPKTIILDSIRTGTLSEIGNIVINAIMGSICNMMGFSLKYSSPMYLEGNYEKLSRALRTSSKSVILQARAQFIIRTLAVIGDIVLFLELDSLDRIFSIIERVESNGK